MSHSYISKNNMLEVLQKNRKQFLDSSPVWSKILSVLNLEKEFGNILYLPLDIEPIFNEYEEALFKEWFFDKCKPIKKFNPSSGIQWAQEDFPYDAISTVGLSDGVYEQNPIDINSFFPQIEKRLRQLPFKAVPGYRVWSSKVDVPAHRDAFYPLDLPSSFRFVLFDENPKSTLWLQEHSKNGEGEKFAVSRDKCFAWNNTRVIHSSYFDASYRKAILIPEPIQFDAIQFKKLVIRSIKKFENEVIFSNKDINDFI